MGQMRAAMTSQVGALVQSWRKQDLLERSQLPLFRTRSYCPRMPQLLNRSQLSMPGLEVLLKMQGNLEHMWSVFRKPGVSIEIFKPFFADNIQPCPLPSAPEKSTPGHS